MVMVSLPVEEPSQTGEVRRRCAALCRNLGFDETAAGRAALVATELATNLVKHARGGRVLLQPLACSGRAGVELLALDGGPGFPDAARCLADGYSTAGSPGTGLGSLMRLSTDFDLYSRAGSGTVVVSRVLAGDPDSREPAPAFTVGAVCLPYRDDEPCGDAWAVAELPGRLVILVADGLGHGVNAAVAANAAVASFRKQAAGGTRDIVEAIHSALRSTRGAAVAVAEVVEEAPGAGGGRLVRFTGLGNISARVESGGATRNLVSLNGTAGAEARKIQEFTAPWPEDGMLVFHSDGLGTRWSLGEYPGLAARHPSLVAGVLFRDFCRGRDDVTVLAVKGRASQ